MAARKHPRPIRTKSGELFEQKQVDIKAGVEIQWAQIVEHDDAAAEHFKQLPQRCGI